MAKSTGLYDSDQYYDSDGQASRLAPSLNGLLYALDWFKAWAFARRLNGLYTIRPNGAQARPRVLDVGAGDGKFLYFMRRFGFAPFGTTASEISQKAAKARWGIDLDHSLDVPMRLKTLEVITYWHVFEHLTDPDGHMASWSRVLESGGAVMIEVPNIESVGARLCYDAWLGSDDKHHINHMTTGQIVEMAQRHGFQVVRKEGFSLKFSYPFMWSALIGRLFGRERYSFDQVFATLKNPVARLGKAPFVTINAVASVIYLAPVIAGLCIWGLLSGRGEVLRLYLKKS